jgi:hypothetical protein
MAEDSEASQHGGGGHDAAHASVGERLQQGEWQGAGDFVSEVLRTYHSHFWLFFRITAPAVIIGTIAIIMGRNEARENARHLPPGFDFHWYRAEMFETDLVIFSQFLVSWMGFSFSYGAICIAVDETAAGFTPSAWHSLLNIRERLGPFLRLCLLLFFLVLAAEGASVLLGIGVFWVRDQWHVHPSRFLISVASYGVVGLMFLVISRFALAVPAVILDDYKVGKAMFRSDELTQGKWLTLAALLAKSLIGGYVAGMCPFWLVSLVHVNGPLPSWFPWTLTVASIIGVTVAEPPMFIGFALLYLKMSALSSGPSKVLDQSIGVASR